ncbi:MAG: MASE3 domain-containing protein, partial [Paenibacillus sp.]|uniref:MASE3 domain-containing protein n=2 Tax=Paenibacillus TaxID=44249 RepID=UPI002911028F
MRIRTEEQTTIIQGVIGLAAMVGVVRLSAWNGFPPGMDAVFQTLHLLAGLMCLAVSFAIFAQGWILFIDKLSKQRLYTAVLFAMIGILDILYAASHGDIQLLGFEPGGTLASWFLVISHLLGALGMPRIFASQDHQILGHQKIAMFAGVGLLTLVGLLVFNRYQGSLPSLFDLELGLLIIRVGIPLLYILAAIAILYRHRTERPPAIMTVTRALLFMAMGHVLMTYSPGNAENLAQVVGQWYMGISYYIVLKGVYRLTIEEPMRGKQLAEAQMKHMAY